MNRQEVVYTWLLAGCNANAAGDRQILESPLFAFLTIGCSIFRNHHFVSSACCWVRAVEKLLVDSQFELTEPH